MKTISIVLSTASLFAFTPALASEPQTTRKTELATAAVSWGLTFQRDGSDMLVFKDDRRLLTWHDYRNHVVSDQYFLITDTDGITCAYDYSGKQIVRWTESTELPWLVQRDYFILVDVKGVAGAYSSAGVELTKWYDYSYATTADDYFIFVDTKNIAQAFSKSGQSLVKWYDHTYHKAESYYFALSDNKNVTDVYNLSGTKLVRWNDTRSYELLPNFFALFDTDGVLEFYDLNGGRIQRVDGVSDLQRSGYYGVRYLKNGNWYEFYN